MRRIQVKVDIEGATKAEVINQLQQLIWDVKELGVDHSQYRPAMWRHFTERDRAELAAEYARLGERTGAVQALADAHGWKKSFAMDCIQRLRGQGYLELTYPPERPAVAEKTLELLGNDDETMAPEQGA